ncbi:hypothetical protein FPOA_06748 [Fusarium poae]|uniref:Heterokaryon incompatibility domain-containing protein n=1 Tax=Fusarium poae TaxID=36050 RepID=A0A1B8AIH6_FUSPO|nr:hypothetical protein FPOA_06748 [Fusarium poae]
MRPQNVPSIQKLVCPEIPAGSALGQTLRRGGYSVDGDFMDKDEALAWAIMKKETELVKAIVKDGVNIDLRTGPYQTAALHVAVYAGSCEIISILKDAGASLEVKDGNGLTSLDIAASCGLHEVAELLCDLGADTECHCTLGRTPLHSAAQGGYTKIIQLLFYRNIDIDCRDNEERTPLAFASRCGKMQAVQLLVELGADISLRDKDGNTPMHYAAEHDHVTIVEYFIELGADLTVINNYGYTVLSLAAFGKAQQVVSLIVGLEGIDVNRKNHRSVIVPLIAAASSGSLEIARLLVTNGAFLEVTDYDEKTPLHYASIYGHAEVAKFLLDKGANIESRSIAYQRTPFLLAAIREKIEVVRLLARYGADREAKDSDGHCALHYVALTANNILLRCLLNIGVDMEAELPNGATVLEHANAAGKTEIVSLLVEHGANIMVKWKEKCSVAQRPLSDQLIACAKHGNVIQITRLLDEGVDIHVLSTFGRSALSVAAEYGHQDVINLVLARGGILDFQDASGETALWWASHCNHIGVVQRLLELGAQVDLTDSDGNTPLCVACQKGLVNIVKCLLEAGSDPNTMTNYGMTPLLLAATANHMDVVGLLIGKGFVTAEQTGPAINGGTGSDGLINIMRHFCDLYGRDRKFEHLGLDKNIAKNASHPRQYGTTHYDSVESLIFEDESLEYASSEQNEIDSPDNGGDPIYGEHLALAASKGHVPEMLSLIKAGANVDGSNRVAIPLLCAAFQNEERAVKTLIENGAQVDRVDHRQNTALCIAAHQGYTTIINLLCQYNANIDHKGENEMTPIAFAVLGEHADAVEILLDRGARTEFRDGNLNLLDGAVFRGSEPVIEVLLRKGAKVRAVDETGYTPLLTAVEKGNRNVAEFLLKNGAGLDFVPGSKCSPMLEAINSGQAVMVELLAKYGADVNHLEDTDRTPMIVAAQSGKDMVVQSLIDMGADLGGQDDRCRTALSYANENSQKSTVKLLLQAQALRRDCQYMKKAEEQRKDPKTSFEYQPLSEGFIRVLELQRGKRGDVVSFSLIHVELSKPPSFEALSYEWKGKTGTVPTYCDGERILVTPNCCAALEILRCETETRLLWIDAICINQQDTTERGNQVSMMSGIYSKATSVLMWIGEDEDHSDRAFSSIPVLTRALQRLQKSPKFKHIPLNLTDKHLRLGLPEVQKLIEQLKPRVAPETWEAWRKLYRRSYFTRAWIFQEIILAGPRGTVMCGTQQCTWDTFKAATQVYETFHSDYDSSLEWIIILHDQYRLHQSLKLDLTLRAMSNFEAGDLRDKVYAALGLTFADWRDHHAWQPVQIPNADYTKSVNEVFINANRYIISLSDSVALWSVLDPINQSTATGGTKGLPSWAFDFGKPADTRGIPFPPENAEYEAFIRGHPTTTRTSLHVNGYVIDVVNSKIPITKDKGTMDLSVSGSQEDFEKGSVGTNLAALLRTLMSLGDCSADESMNFEAYVAWKLMMDNDTSEIFRAPPDSLQDRIGAWKTSSKELPDFDLSVCKNMERLHCYGYDLVYTEKGHFGLAPSREGNEGLVLAVVGGCRDLVLLRRKSSDQDTWYEYVSQVYMYGWTKDKIRTVEDLGGDLKEVRFEIR